MPEGWLPLSKTTDLSIFRHPFAGRLLHTERSHCMTQLPSPEEVEAARSPKGGYSKTQLAAWGVQWPPPKGWKDELTERWKAARQDGAPPPALPNPAPVDLG